MKDNKISRTKVIKKSLLVFILVLSIQQLSSGTYIYAKANLAQYLIKLAWQGTLDGGQQVKPWSWADTWPVAKLSSKKYQTSLYVLSGDNGRTLAFGPGYRVSTVIPGAIGNSIISGHRNTHFSFLRKIKISDVFELQTRSGEIIQYRVTETKIVSIDEKLMLEDRRSSNLELVTCYPFDSFIPGGKLRYIVSAQQVEGLLPENLSY